MHACRGHTWAAWAAPGGVARRISLLRRTPRIPQAKGSTRRGSWDKPRSCHHTKNKPCLDITDPPESWYNPYELARRNSWKQLRDACSRAAPPWLVLALTLTMLANSILAAGAAALELKTTAAGTSAQLKSQCQLSWATWRWDTPLIATQEAVGTVVRGGDRIARSALRRAIGNATRAAELSCTVCLITVWTLCTVWKSISLASTQLANGITLRAHGLGYALATPRTWRRLCSRASHRALARLRAMVSCISSTVAVANRVWNQVTNSIDQRIDACIRYTLVFALIAAATWSQGEAQPSHGGPEVTLQAPIPRAKCTAHRDHPDYTELHATSKESTPAGNSHEQWYFVSETPPAGHTTPMAA